MKKPKKAKTQKQSIKKPKKRSVKIDWPSPRGNIKLKVLGTQQDWENFLRLGRKGKGRLLKRIDQEICHQVVERWRKKPRGAFGDDQHFTGKMKEIASLTCYFLAELWKNRPDSWFVKALIEEYEGEQGPVFSDRGKTVTPKPYELTALIFNRFFAKDAKRRGLKADWADEAEKFRRTYILDMRRFSAVWHREVPQGEKWAKLRQLIEKAREGIPDRPPQKIYESYLDSLRRNLISLIEYHKNESVWIILQLFYEELLEDSPFQALLDQSPPSP